MVFYVFYRKLIIVFFFFQAEDGIRDGTVTGVQTCALPILAGQITNVSTHVDASPALAEVLTHDRAKVGLRMIFDGTSFPIQGRETLTKLTATVLLKQDL